MAAENFKVKKGLEVGTGSTITSGGINVTGVITATQLVGDGSGLTNVVGSGSGIVVKDEGSAVGTAGTINFVGSGVVASLAAGQATITISSGGLNDVVDDTTPQLGGGLDLNSKFISGSGGINVTGIVTATTFVGNGDFVNLDVSGITTSALLDVGNLTNGRVPYIGSASGRLVDSANLTFDGSSLFVSGINVVSGGTTSTFGADIVTRHLRATGISTFNSHLSIGGALTASSATFTNNVSVGGNMTATLFDISPGSGNDAIILVSSGGGQNNDFSRIRQVVSDDSFRIENKASGSYESLFEGKGGAGVKLYFAGTEKFETTGTGIASPNISVSGVGTFSTRIDTNGVSFGTNSTTFAAKFADDAVANFGAGNDLRIYHDDGNGLSYIRQDGTGPLDIRSINDINIRDGNDGDLFIECKESEGVKLYYEGNEKLEVTNHGAIITGVCTATSFSGDGSGLTGVTASGTGIVIQHDGSNVGTAGTINFSTNLDVSPVSAGIVTVTASGGSSSQDKIEEGNSTAEVIGSGTNDGEFLVKLQDATVSGAGVTALKLYQSSSSTTSLELFEENKSQNAYLDINNAYTSNASIRINFKSTGFANRTGTIYYSPVSESFEIRDNAGASMLSINSGISGSAGSVVTSKQFFPNSDNSLKCGTSSLRWSELHAVNVQVGIVTAATRFVGSGVSLTSLNASELDSGTIPSGRFPATLPAVSGANLTNLPVPTSINLTNQASDTECFLVFAQAATNAQTPHTNTTLKFNSSTEVLSATKFSGSGENLTNLNASNIGSGTMSASRLTGALPAISGANLTSIPAGNLTGTVADARITTLTASKLSGALPAISGANLTGIAVTVAPVTSYTITADGGSNYYFEHGGVDKTDGNPDLYLERGQKYRFNNTTGTGHPFRFTGTGNKNDTYSDGVTGSENGVQFFTVPYDAPSRIFYVCTIHGGMVGNIYIRGANGHNANVGVTTFSGAVTATSFTGSIAASNVNSGTLGSDRIPNLAASKITSGTFDAARIPTLNQNTTGNAASADTVDIANVNNNATYYPVFVDNNGSGKTLNIVNASQLTYNPSTSVLRAETIGVGQTANISSRTYTFTASAGTTVTTDSTAIGSANVIEYTIYISNSTNIQSQKVLIMDNGTTAYISEFSVMSNPNLIATFSADVNGGNVRLRATPETGISGSTTIKFTKMIIE